MEAGFNHTVPTSSLMWSAGCHLLLLWHQLPLDLFSDSMTFGDLTPFDSASFAAVKTGPTRCAPSIRPTRFAIPSVLRGVSFHQSYEACLSICPSYHSLSHHSFSDDSQLYKSGNITRLPEIIRSAQSCISDVKAWMTNNELQLNNDKTEMILIATKTVLN